MIGLLISVGLNLFVAVPAIAVFFLRSAVRLTLHEQAASRICDPTIVFLGDSITRDGGIWAMRIHRPFFTVRNFGQSGFYTEQMMGQAHAAGAVNVEKAFIMAGINDANQPGSSAEDSFVAYTRIVEVLQSQGVEPVIQSTLYTERDEHQVFVTKLNSLLRGYAEENEIHFIDLNEALSAGMHLKSEFSRDGVHLTDEAYVIWAEKIRDFLNL